VRLAGGISAQEARWLALSAQGLARPRPAGPGSLRHLRAAIKAVGVVQLDAINVLERTQFVVLFSRVGAYGTERLHEMSGPGGELLEAPGFRASLVPMVQQPLSRTTIARGPSWDSPTYAPRVEAYREANAGYIAAVLAEITDRGPLAASQLTDPRRRNGEW